MRRMIVVGAILILVVVLSASFLIANNDLLSNKSSESSSQTPQAPFYVGVTYGGDSSAEAKLLIDRVKNYTNLFVIQSGQLEKNLTELSDIGNYAVGSGLHIIVYFSAVPYYRQYITSFLAAAKTWGNNLLGIYFDDEPGGKMLDAPNVNLYDAKTNSIITKTPNFLTVTQADGTKIDYAKDGSVEVEASDALLYYQPDGTIHLTVNFSTPNPARYIIQANGSVYLLDDKGNVASQLNDTSSLPKIESYQQIMAQKPYQTYDDTAQIFVTTCQNSTGWLHSQTSVKVFTSDYALYWFDYLGGYDVVLAQLGWNHTTAQDIALARGAANVQGKDWGAIITWKYNQPPYLGGGDEMYDQMRLAYEAGAKYIVVFNYPTYPANNSYGILQDEHFSALQRFWTDTVQNQTVTNGGTKAEAALVLPNNYGWGMRNQQDNIWGLWQPDNSSLQVWSKLQNALATYSSRLDVVYDDSAYPVSGKYTQVYYWNQTG